MPPETTKTSTPSVNTRTKRSVGRNEKSQGKDKDNKEKEQNEEAKTEEGKDNPKSTHTKRSSTSSANTRTKRSVGRKEKSQSGKEKEQNEEAAAQERNDNLNSTRRRKSMSGMSNLRYHLEQRKKAREVARQQEKNFLEFRKLSILYELRPKKQFLVACDDGYPKRKFNYKDMAFGLRKSYFLSLRPDKRFADWHGKDKVESKTPKGFQSKVEEETMKNVAKVEALTTTQGNTAASSKKKDDYDDIIDEKIDILTKIKIRYGTEKPERGDEVRGIRWNLPLKEDGINWFWVNSGEDETTDEDSPIDIDMMESVLRGEKSLKPAPYKRDKFNPFDKLSVLRKVDNLCKKDTHTLANTLMTLMLISPDVEDAEPPENIGGGKKKPKKVSWAMTVDEYVGQGSNDRLLGPKAVDGELKKTIKELKLHYKDG